MTTASRLSPSSACSSGANRTSAYDDTVEREVLHALERDAAERIRLLHHADGVGEGLEVQLEVPTIGAASHPLGEVVHIGRRQAVVAVLRGEFDHRGGAQTAVEVVVQQDLGRPADELGVERDHRRSSRGGIARMLGDRHTEQRNRTLRPNPGADRRR